MLLTRDPVEALGTRLAQLQVRQVADATEALEILQAASQTAEGPLILLATALAAALDQEHQGWRASLGLGLQLAVLPDPWDYVARLQTMKKAVLAARGGA